MIKEEMIEIAISNGYHKEGYGYKKVTKNNTHWISDLDDHIQLYAYFTEDPECDKEYDTGVISISSLSPVVFKALLDCFSNNYD